MAEKLATLMEVKNFFGFDSGADFRSQWLKIDEAGRDAIRVGIANGSLTY